jgi:hypothetical protein
VGSNLPGSIREPSFTNLVGDVFTSFDELTSAGEAVRQLMGSPGWAHVIRLVDAERSKIDSQLDGGLLPSRADYARAHGRRSGLRGLEAAAHAIVTVSDRKLAEQRSKHESGADASLEAMT